MLRPFLAFLPAMLACYLIGRESAPRPSRREPTRGWYAELAAAPRG